MLGLQLSKHILGGEHDGCDKTILHASQQVKCCAVLCTLCVSFECMNCFHFGLRAKSINVAFGDELCDVVRVDARCKVRSKKTRSDPGTRSCLAKLHVHNCFEKLLAECQILRVLFGEGIELTNDRSPLAPTVQFHECGQQMRIAHARWIRSSCRCDARLPDYLLAGFDLGLRELGDRSHHLQEIAK